MQKTDKYAEYADHPRYGRRPNITGLNPSPLDRNVQLHWNSTTHHEMVAQFESIIGKKWPYGPLSAEAEHKQRIANTAIPADLTLQTSATVPVTHYFDLERKCRDCARLFIFFAEEQKHWYEDLGFGLESDCIRCAECRKQQQGIARDREVYESLFHIPDKTVEQLLEMAEAGLALIESGIFTTKQTQRIRMLLNSVPDDADVCKRSRYARLMQRVDNTETKKEDSGR